MARKLVFTDGRTMELGKILAIALNYRAHASEFQSNLESEPKFFLKPGTAFIGDGEDILLPPQSAQVDEEVELAAVIGTAGRNIPEVGALGHVAGYGIILDITARDLQAAAKSKGRPWAASKGFDTFAPISVIVPASQVPDPQRLRLRLLVNGEVRQDGTTADMVFPVASLIHHLSTYMTLEPGDVIATGTPHGVSVLRDGDVVVSEIEGIVRMTNRVRTRA